MTDSAPPPTTPPTSKSSNVDADVHPLVVTEEALESYSEDVNYLWCTYSTSGSQMPVLQAPPSSLVFLRDYVAMSRPCIIRNSILVNRPNEQEAEQEQDQSQQHHQQPLTLSLDELVELADRNLWLTVDVTPDGHGDCLRMVKQKQQQQATSGASAAAFAAAETETDEEESCIYSMFVKPQERRLTLSEFRTLLRASQRHGWQESVRSSSGSGGGGGRGDSLAAIRYRVFTSAAAATNDDSSRGNEADTSNDSNESGVLSASSVYYYSRQNDCLRTELGSLWEQQQDVMFPRGFPWAAQAFGSGDDSDDATPESSSSSTSLTATTTASSPMPDAVNLWIGNERAVSAMHKDHYENLFYVLHGEKIFTLCPPGDAPFLYEGEYPSGRFEQCRGAYGDDDDDNKNIDWHVRIDHVDGTTTPSTVHWIAANVMDDKVGTMSNPRFPLLRHAHPIQVRVQAGEMLYLPSLWFHQVTQTCETVAINYWYDMKFNSPLWCYFHLLSQLKAPSPPAAARSVEATTTSATCSGASIPDEQKGQE